MNLRTMPIRLTHLPPTGSGDSPKPVMLPLARVQLGVTVHGSKTLKMQAIFDATEREYRLIWAWPAEKPRFRDDFATFARERLRLGVGGRLGAGRDAEQRTESVERIEASVEAECELVEVRL